MRSSASSVLMSPVTSTPPEPSSCLPASRRRPAAISSFRNSRWAGRVFSTTSGDLVYVDFRTWITTTTLVDRRVDPAQIGQHPAGGDDALSALPHLVVDDEDAVVLVGGQLLPGIAAHHIACTALCLRRGE